MGISLAVVAVGVFSAAAQPPGPIIPPAPNFQPYPTVPPSTSPPMVQPPSAPSSLPRLVPADAPNPVNPIPQGRTVTFQKPAGRDVTVPTVLGTMPAPPAPIGVQPRQLVPADRPVMAQTPPEDTKDKDIPKAKSDPTTAALPTQTSITREKAFRLMSDAELNKRIADELVQEARDRKIDSKPSNFAPPAVTPLVPVGTVYQSKTASYPPAQTLLEPKYVVHRRLLFEEKNSERHGWDLGFVQPVVSAAFFYKDVFMWPTHLASHLWERYDTSAGKCPPGSPVPYFLYPPEVDILGLGTGASVMVGAAFIFP